MHASEASDRYGAADAAGKNACSNRRAAGLARSSEDLGRAEVGELSRFEHPRQFMGYSGAVSREHPSGERVQRGAISNAGTRICGVLWRRSGITGIARTWGLGLPLPRAKAARMRASKPSLRGRRIGCTGVAAHC